jgi:hypothetical protein
MRPAERLGQVTLLSVMAAACSGQIAGPAGGEAGMSGNKPPGMGSGGSAGTGGATGTPSPADVLNLPSAPLPTTGLHRLTAWEFTNSLQDLLGKDVPLAPVEADTLIGGFATVGASSVSISPAGVGQYETVLGNATTYAFADPARVAAILPCVPKATTDTACLTQAVNGFGRRAFRRPLTSDETKQFLGLATNIGSQAGSNVLTGVRYAVWAMLQSPDFLYRVELGAPSAADGGRLKYTSFEMASRLAAMRWASLPDDALLDVAAQDALATPASAVGQAQKMLSDPRVHRSLAAFVDQLFDSFSFSQADKDMTLYPAYTATLRPAMLQELELRVDDMVFAQKGDYLSLFESTTTFVNKELAACRSAPPTTASIVSICPPAPRASAFWARLPSWLAMAMNSSRHPPTAGSSSTRCSFVERSRHRRPASLRCRQWPPPAPRCARSSARTARRPCAPAVMG